MTKFYELGNCLRGYFNGMFETADEAWDVMSAQFNEAFPSRCGREVELRTVIRTGLTAGGNETERDRETRMKLEAILVAEQAQAEEAALAYGVVA